MLLGTPHLTEPAFRTLCLLLGINCSIKSTMTDIFQWFEMLMTPDCQNPTRDVPLLTQSWNKMEHLAYIELQTLLGQHGFPHYPNLTGKDLQNFFWLHLIMGTCYQITLKDPLAVNSSHPIFLPPTLIPSPLVWSIMVLVKQYCNIHILKYVLTLKNVHFFEFDSIQHIHEWFLNYLTSTTTGRRIHSDIQ